MSLAPGTVEALLYRGRLRVRRAFRRSWPATVVVPVWLRDALVRLATQLETSVSAAPAARVVAGVAVAVVAASAATIEIEHQHAKPRAPRVQAVTRDTPVAARRPSATSEMVSFAGNAGTRGAARALGGPGEQRPRPCTAREDKRSGAWPLAAAHGGSGELELQSRSVRLDRADKRRCPRRGRGRLRRLSPPRPATRARARTQAGAAQTLAQPDSSGPSVESSSSGPSFEASGSGPDGSNSGPGSLSSGSDSSGSGSDSSVSSSTSSSSGSDSRAGGDGHSGSGG